MNNRINKIFSNKNKKLATFVTGGDPDLKTSSKIINSLAENGSDLIEIGMPFSDPMADGPTIQLSSNRAIINGINLDNIFDICKSFREFNSNTPLILMGYYNVIFHYGVSKFVDSCNKCGVDGLIVVDLQPEEDPQLLNALKPTKIDLIRLITPTTNKDRLKTILQNASGFLYYVSITGITGQHSADVNKLQKSILEVKNQTNLPILSGFGINTAKQVKEICSFCDGVIVGSSIVKIIEENYNTNNNNIIPLISKFISNLKVGIH